MFALYALRLSTNYMIVSQKISEKVSMFFLISSKWSNARKIEKNEIMEIFFNYCEKKQWESEQNWLDWLR